MTFKINAVWAIPLMFAAALSLNACSSDSMMKDDGMDKSMMDSQSETMDSPMMDSEHKEMDGSMSKSMDSKM